MVDRETSVVKAPGVMVAMRLSYRDSSLTELRPAKVSLLTQLIRLLLSILQGEGWGRESTGVILSRPGQGRSGVRVRVHVCVKRVLTPGPVQSSRSAEVCAVRAGPESPRGPPVSVHVHACLCMLYYREWGSHIRVHMHMHACCMGLVCVYISGRRRDISLHVSACVCHHLHVTLCACVHANAHG